MHGMEDMTSVVRPRAMDEAQGLLPDYLPPIRKSGLMYCCTIRKNAMHMDD
jgi:hypothetical protein